jgi:hypothetical protein
VLLVDILYGDIGGVLGFSDVRWPPYSSCYLLYGTSDDLAGVVSFIHPYSRLYVSVLDQYM